MSTITQVLVAAAIMAAAAAPAFAQQQTTRIRGPIQALDGSMITVKAGEAGDLKVRLADNVAVFGVVKADLADVKPGDFISVGASRKPTAASAPSRSRFLPRCSAGPAKATGRGIARTPR